MLLLLLLLLLLLVDDRPKGLFHETVDSTVRGGDKEEPRWSHHDCNSLKKAKVWRIKIMSLVAERRRLTGDDDVTTSVDVMRWDGAQTSNDSKTSDEDDATWVGVCLKDIAFFEEEIAADSLQLLRKTHDLSISFPYPKMLQRCFLSSRVVSWRALSCFVLSCLCLLPYRVLSCLVWSGRIGSGLVLSCVALTTCPPWISLFFCV
jgi:hypothetical protein